MQLVSPGVSVSIIDESVYGSAGPGTVPIFFVATSESLSHCTFHPVVFTTTEVSVLSFLEVLSHHAAPPD